MNPQPASLENDAADLDSVGIENRMNRIRADLVERIWHGIAIIAIVGVPASVLRSASTGWLPMYSAHIGIGAAVLLAWSLRRRLPLQLRVALVMLMFWAVGLIGLFTLGLLGAGLWWLVMSSLLMSTLYTPRAGVMTVLAALPFLILAGTGFVEGWLVLPFDANAYIRQPASWITFLVATSLMPIIVFLAVAGLQRTTLSLLDEVEQQRDHIAYLATHDALTGLPTMRLGEDRLDKALRASRRSGHRLAVLFADLDGFKAVNDSHGHDVGDQVLVTVAQRFQDVLRASDTVARKGGDEFIVVLEDISDAAAALEVAEKMIAMVSFPVRIRGLELKVGASIGIALSPDHGTDAATLLDAADHAMYAAKHAGRNCARMAGTKVVQLRRQAS